MSWAQWPQTAVPQPPPAPANTGSACAAPQVSVAPAGVTYSPSVPPPTSYTPAQFAALSPEQQYAIQQNWQQWQTYHQQYAQWHAQYGEQYQREMQAKLGMVAPTLPFVPPIPPYAAPIPPTVSATYSVPPPPPTQKTSYPSAPNISAVASQPPPPPPPPEESTEKRDNSGTQERDIMESKPASESQSSENLRPEKDPLDIKPMLKSYERQSQQDQQYEHRPQQWKSNNDSKHFSGNYGENYTNRNSRFWGGNDSDNRRGNHWQFNQQYSKEQSDQMQNQSVMSAQPSQQQSFEQGICNQSSTVLEKKDDEKTPEERAFDEQFKKWEEEFENWKRQNANHPDRQAYKEYEMKFEDCRRKLLERRELMRKRKLERKLKQEQESKMKEQQENINSKKEENIENPAFEHKQPEVCDTINISPEKSDFKNEDGEDKGLPENCNEAENSEPEHVEFLKTTKTDGIPGLDLVSSSEEKCVRKADEVTEVIDLDADTKVDRDEPVATSILEQKHEARESVTEIVHMPCDQPKILQGKIEDKLQINEIPSLLSQKFEKPVLSPPVVERENDIIKDDKDSEMKQNPYNEKFSTFLSAESATSITCNELTDKNRFSGAIGEKGGVPAGIAELASALSDPNVLALITAAIGNRTENNVNVADNQGAPSKISPWMAGQEPFQNQNQMLQNQNQNQMFQNQLRCTQQNYSSRDFGPSNNTNFWQESGAVRNNPWDNRNSGDNRGNLNPWQKHSSRQNDSRRTGMQSWQSARDSRNASWQDDVDMRQNIFDRNNSMDKLDERSKSDEKMADRERTNPFKDHDDRGNRINPFSENNDRERGRQYEDRNSNSRSAPRNRDRSRSSGRSGGQDESSLQGFHRNPFKTEPNIFDKPLDSSNPDQSGGNEDYFRPTHVIDYQNKSLDADSRKNDILLPRKVVDYGHKPSASNDDNENKKDFFPMKTIDYGHSSAKSELESNIEGRKNDFHAGRNRNRNRNRNKKKSGLQESNATYPGPWSLLNQTSRERPGLPTKRGKKSKIFNKDSHLLIKSEFAINSIFENSTIYETQENFDEISEDDNAFDESVSAKPSDIEELNTVATPVLEDKIFFPVFPIKEITPSPELQKKVQLIVPTMENNNTITIDEILLKPGRESRPKKIVIILRGPPGSGKSYVAKLIKEKEVEMGGSTPRLLSIDDYFMIEVDKERKCPTTGRKVIVKEMIYQYEKDMEESYMQYLIKAFKKTVNDRLFDFIIVDCINQSLRTFTEFYNNAKSANFTPYTIDLLCDLETCLSRNIHKRPKGDIEQILGSWIPTPVHYIKLDVASLLQNVALQEQVEDISDAEDAGVHESEGYKDSREYIDEVCDFFLKSKWDVEVTEEKLARLDGTSKPLHKNATLEEYLQMDGWEPPHPSANNKKRVRWADIEEKRAQDKMRAIGFVVGHTDWNRMMDPSGGSNALTKTKYIEKINKRN